MQAGEAHAIAYYKTVIQVTLMADLFTVILAPMGDIHTSYVLTSSSSYACELSAVVSAPMLPGSTQ